ncbi:hypothetical protein [Desulfobacter postgatei]|uniref:Uncharacterized protein n=1 Tax=Desulfobacter postgatei 2ac9 TaxID=879212 RepID=I5B3P9_9BACT|nr:hypothetical protein [Desulfobacter postgatei]EIM64112.1 hypothetical protein DespoDRAFT_02236 [Desulfobacter postgatei 2ac9]
MKYGQQSKRIKILAHVAFRCLTAGAAEFRRGRVVDPGLHVPDPSVEPGRKRHGTPEHGGQQGFGGMGAEDLAFKPGINNVILVFLPYGFDLSRISKYRV